MKNNVQFSTWKTIKLGTFKNVNEIKEAIIGSGFKIGDWANDVLNSSHFLLALKLSEVSLVKITPLDLGFSEKALRKDIYKKALELGLKLCPLEVGPQLRLQYLNQPKLESIYIAMKSQFDSEKHESIFRVVHGGDGFIWLVGDHKHLDDFWSPDTFFVFIK